MSHIPGEDYIGLSIAYSELLLIPAKYFEVLRYIRFANTRYITDGKELEIKNRPTEFTYYTAEQIQLSLVTAKLTGESS